MKHRVFGDNDIVRKSRKTFISWYLFAHCFFVYCCFLL